jgi:hypothetical protein
VQFVIAEKSAGGGVLGGFTKQWKRRKTNTDIREIQSLKAERSDRSRPEASTWWMSRSSYTFNLRCASGSIWVGRPI